MEQTLTFSQIKIKNKANLTNEITFSNRFESKVADSAKKSVNENIETIKSSNE